MTRKRTLSVIAIFALMVILPLLTATLIRNDFKIRIKALEDDTPHNVVVSDIRDASFRVSWITERSVIGGILLSDGVRFVESTDTSYHSINIVGLKQSTQYSFQLLSGTKPFEKEGGGDYVVKTSSVAEGDETYLVYGQVFSPDGYSFQQGGVITFQLSDEILTSQVLSTIINETGGYQFDLGELQSEALDKKFSYKAKVDVVFGIYAGHDQGIVEKRYTLDFTTNRQIPNIYLGEVNIDVIPAIEGL
jgi:hypothetical protein